MAAPICHFVQMSTALMWVTAERRGSPVIVRVRTCSASTALSWSSLAICSWMGASAARISSMLVPGAT